MSIKADICWLPYFRVEEIDGAVWALAFYHSYKNLKLWPRDNTTKFHLSKDMYSILGLLDDTYKYNEKFEFLLRYPKNDGFNRWRQSLNPIYDLEINKEGYSTAVGYEPVNVWWNQSTGFEYFGGLVVSSSGYSFLEGYVSTIENSKKWYYSIGQHIHWNDGDGIAGYKFGHYIESVELWIRVRGVEFNHWGTLERVQGISSVLLSVLFIKESDYT